MLKKSLILIACTTPTLSFSMDWVTSLVGASSNSPKPLTPLQIQTGIEPQYMCCPPSSQQHTAVLLARAKLAKELYPYQIYPCFMQPNEQANSKINSLTKWIPQPTDPRWMEWKQKIMEAVRAGGNTNRNLMTLNVGQDKTGTDVYRQVPMAIALESDATESRLLYNPTPPINEILSVVVKSGDTECVKELIQHGAFVNAIDMGNGDGPLASAKTVAMAALLIALGGQPKYIFDKSGNTLLPNAMKKGYEAGLIPLYVQQGVDPNGCDMVSKESPLEKLFYHISDLDYPIETILQKILLLLAAGAKKQYPNPTITYTMPEVIQRCVRLKQTIADYK